MSPLLLGLLALGGGMAMLGRSRSAPAPTGHLPRAAAPGPADIDRVDQVTGKSGTVWNVETLIARGESSDGSATMVVRDRQMQPVLEYVDDGDKVRFLTATYSPSQPQVKLARTDFGLNETDSSRWSGHAR